MGSVFPNKQLKVKRQNRMCWPLMKPLVVPPLLQKAAGEELACFNVGEMRCAW